MDELIILWWTFFFILVTCLLDFVLMFYEEILSWPLLKVHVSSTEQRPNKAQKVFAVDNLTKET